MILLTTSSHAHCVMGMALVPSVLDADRMKFGCLHKITQPRMLHAVCA